MTDDARPTRQPRSRSGVARPSAVHDLQATALSESEVVSLAARLERVWDNIARAAKRAGRRPEDVTLVGASKMVSPAASHAAARLGLRNIGENYIQEASGKRRALDQMAPVELRWHLIGHLQTNKVKVALELFDIIQTVDGLRLADAISSRMAPRSVAVLLEVKFGEEPGRLGFRPNELGSAVSALRDLPGLSLQGLMAVPPLGLTPGETRRIFAELRELRERLASDFPNLDLRHLSMGMTDDYEMAIEEGATIVRVGRAIFGERPTR